MPPPKDVDEPVVLGEAHVDSTRAVHVKSATLEAALARGAEPLSLRVHFNYEPDLAGGREHEYASELAPVLHVFATHGLGVLERDADDDGVVVVPTSALEAQVAAPPPGAVQSKELPLSGVKREDVERRFGKAYLALDTLLLALSDAGKDITDIDVVAEWVADSENAELNTYFYGVLFLNEKINYVELARALLGPENLHIPRAFAFMQRVIRTTDRTAMTVEDWLIDQALDLYAVSYTHLTLPTILLV